MLIKTVLLVSGTLFVAMMLSILPLPLWAVWLRPEWALLLVIYWILRYPEQLGLGFAWLIGLLVDALRGALLGEHALAMVVVAYFVLKFNRQLNNLPIWQQSLIICLLVFIFRLVLLLIHGMLGDIEMQWRFLMPVLTSVIVWPWVCLLLREPRRRFV